MSNDGSIKIDISVNTDELKTLIDKLDDLVSNGLSEDKTALKVTIDAIAALSAKLADIGKSAIKTGSSFEAGMSQVEAISGATADELQALADKAKEMGVKTKFSASESAGAMSDMAKAGHVPGSRFWREPGDCVKYRNRCVDRVRIAGERQRSFC